MGTCYNYFFSVSVKQGLNVFQILEAPTEKHNCHATAFSCERTEPAMLHMYFSYLFSYVYVFPKRFSFPDVTIYRSHT